MVLRNGHSTWQDVSSGVPQGSILGPLLFIIFMNDVALDVDNIDMYADDSTVSASGKTISAVNGQLNSDMSIVDT